MERSTTAPVAISPARLPYLRGRDGLRALVVMAVLLYPGGLRVMDGFVRVERFIVMRCDGALICHMEKETV